MRPNPMMMSEAVTLPRELRDFIDTAEWTFAKTMPEWHHEYIVRERVDENHFVRLVRHIRANGYEGKFYLKSITYSREKPWEKPLTRPHVRRKLIPSSIIRHPSTRERDMRRVYLPSKEKQSRFQCRSVVCLFALPDFFQEKQAIRYRTMNSGCRSRLSAPSTGSSGSRS